MYVCASVCVCVNQYGCRQATLSYVSKPKCITVAMATKIYLGVNVLPCRFTVHKLYTYIHIYGCVCVSVVCN